MYDDNIDSLQVVHYYHLVLKRPDIKYLALPFRYRFFIGENNDIWFDEDILEG